MIRGATAALVALAVVLGASHAEAQTPSATVVMTASTTSIPVGGTLRLEINVSAMGTDAPAPEVPDLSAFEILSRQTFPMSVRMGGWGGGSMTSSLRLIFVMRATREGRVALSPARIRLGGREIRSNPLTIDVTAPGGPPVVGGPSSGPLPAPAPGPSPPSAAPPEGLLDGAIFDDQAFLRTVVDRGEAYVGEQLTVTVYLYLRGTLSANPAMTREPSRDGFWVQDLVDPASPLPDSVQSVSGMMFHVYPLRRFAAFPLRAGDLEIGAPEISISRASPIDIFMGTPQPDLERAGVPVTVHVVDLPVEGRPADGTPHVGTLALEAMLDRSQVPTGDAVTLTVTATGTGRIDALDLGGLALDGVRVLSPQIDSEVNHPGDRVGGTRRIQWLLVPEREGTFTIPSFRVPVFDVRARSWSLVETAPIALVAAGNPIGGPAPDPAEPEVEVDGEAPITLGPVRTESALERHRVRIAAASWFGWTVAAMPLLLALVGLGRLLASRKPAAEKGPVRGAREGKKRLDHAAGLAKAGDARGFYGTVTLALKSVVEGKLGESVGSLTHPQLHKRLVARGMIEPLAKRLVDELEASEFARFSTSGAAGAEMQATLERAQKLLGELERFTPTEEDA